MINFDFDINKLNEQGVFSHDYEYFFNRLINKVDWLEANNKNYTKQQYYFICDVKAFLKALKIKTE